MTAADAVENRQTGSYQETYWSKGYVIVAGLFSPDEIAIWQAETSRLLQSDFVSPQNIRTPFRHNSGDFPERIDPVLDISPVFAALAKDARITNIVSDLFGDTAILFKDKLILKLPGVGGYNMHQDQSYWQLCPNNDILSVSVSIDGASGENGGIALYDGYHDRLLTPNGAQRGLNAEEVAGIDPARKFLPTTQPGDLVIFHALTPHESGVNTSDRPRKSLYLSYSAARSGDLYAVYYERYKKIQAEQAAKYAKSPSDGERFFR